ncbi:MAG: hypothetical protein V7672_02465 [Brevundimonas sp.]
MGKPLACSVSFQIRHPVATARDLAVGLPWTMTAGWTAGEPRVTPTGRPLGGVREESYCSFRIARRDDGEMARSISEIMDVLEAHRAHLEEISRTGGRLNIFVFWRAGGDTGETFNADLLGRLASLNVDLGINVYDDRGSQDQNDA